MKDEVENIILKIQKLLKLAESNNEHEAQSAVVMARKLMAKHKLTMEDIDVESEEVTEDSTEWMRSPWKRTLATVLADHFRCKTYINHKRSSYRVKFIGLEEDVKIICLIYRQVINMIEKTSRQKGLDKKSYAIGFISGLDEKLTQQTIELEESEYALVVVTPAKVKDKYEEIKKGFSGCFKGKSMYDIKINHDHYFKGEIDGSNYCKDEQIEVNVI